MTDKTAIVLFSDPASGTEEAAGRAFNALVLAGSLKERGADVVLILQGTGVRWASELVKPDHPFHGAFKAVEDKLLGACAACANAFGAKDAVEAAGIPLVAQKEIPGTAGVVDLSQYIADGYRLVLF